METKVSKVNETKVVICIKDHEKKVSFQNKMCLELCGNRNEQVCTDGCMSYYAELEAKMLPHQNPTENSTKESEKDRPINLQINGHCLTKLLKNKKIQDKKYDVVLIKTADELITVLNLASNTLDLVFAQSGLTRREKEIAGMRFEEGLSHNDICKKLFISRATLKTHINNILKKVPKSLLLQRA